VLSRDREIDLRSAANEARYLAGDFERAAEPACARRLRFALEKSRAQIDTKGRHNKRNRQRHATKHHDGSENLDMSCDDSHL
jgi:hypothetical protein